LRLSIRCSDLRGNDGKHVRHQVTLRTVTLKGTRAAKIFREMFLKQPNS
jgi:hypothetical protein